MNRFDSLVTGELTGLLRAGVPVHGVRVTIRELVVTRLERGPLDAHEISAVVEAAVRTACRLVRELDAPPEIVEAVCRGALDAVRGHGGTSARWLADAASVTSVVLEEVAGEREDDRAWRWLAARLPQW